MTGGRNTVLYRKRARHLRLLAGILDDTGHLTTVTEPPGMPVLHVGRRDGTQHRVVATIGYGEVDWFRWMDGDFLASCDEPGQAADGVRAGLRPWAVVRS